MLSYGIKNIFASLLLLLLDFSLLNCKHNLRTETRNGRHVKDSYVTLLNSLIKINEDRVAALKKLHFLNNINYGKEYLRSSIENRLDDNDDTLERILTILRLLFVDPNNTHEMKDLNKILQEANHVANRPRQRVATFKEHHRKINRFNNVLRQFDDSEENNERDQRKINKKGSESSSSDEELRDEVKNRNETRGRSYYYEYTCGRGRVRCIKACKEAYREACYYDYCGSDLRRSMRGACKSACREWFY